MQKVSQDVIEHCLAGDKAALEALIAAIQERVYNLAVRFLWEPMDAEDATQEILIRVITNLSGFRGESAFETWVHRIAVNHLLNLKARPVETLTFEEGAVHLERARTQDEYEGVDRRLLAEEVKISCTTSMLICLSRPLRMAFILGAILDLSGAEAAAILEISPGAYRKRLSLAREQLRAFMQANCGLFNPETPCRCTKKITYDIAIGRMNPKALRFADKSGLLPDQREAARLIVPDIEMLQNEVAILRSHPEYATPQTTVDALRTLIQGHHGRAVLGED